MIRSIAKTLQVLAFAMLSLEMVADRVVPPIKVPAEVMAGAIIKKVPIKYPGIARAAHVTGVVILQGIIGTDGKVKSLVVLSGPDILAKSALESVKLWEYRPYLLKGEPVEVDTTITATFAMNEKMPHLDKKLPTPDGYKKVDRQIIEDLCIRTHQPEASAEMHGDIAVQIIIDPTGTIEGVRALGGIPELRTDAEDFVKTWRCGVSHDKKGRAQGIDGIVLVKY